MIIKIKNQCWSDEGTHGAVWLPIPDSAVSYDQIATEAEELEAYRRFREADRASIGAGLLAVASCHNREQCSKG